MHFCISLLKTVSLLLMLLWISFTCLAQQSDQKIDSLKSIMPKVSGKEYIEVLFGLAREYGETNYEQCYYYMAKANKAAMSLGDTFNIVRTYRGKAQAYRRLGNLDSAIFLFEKSLPIARRNHYEGEVKSILNALGLAYLFKAEYDDALKYLFESLEIREMENNKNELEVVLNNIGLAYLKLENFDKALYYFQRTMHLINERNDSNNKDLTLLNISNCLAERGNYQDAIDVINKASSICSPNCSDLFKLFAHQELGRISFLQERLAEAKRQYLISYKLTKNSSYERFHLVNIRALIEIHTSLNEFKMAENYLDEAEAFEKSGSSFNDEMSAIYLQLTSSYRKMRNYEKMSFYQGKYITLKDSIFNRKLTNNLMKIEAEHLEKENKTKIESQNKILALNQEIILRQKYLNVFIGIVAVLLVILSVVLIKSNRQKQKLNQLLDKRVMERTQELELNRDVLQRACEERDILISKIISDIKSSLVTIKGLCFLGTKEIHNAHLYLNKVNSTSDKFSEIITKLIYKKLPVSN